MIEHKIYKNTSKILPGRYSNKDMSRGGKIFMKCDGDSIWLTNDFTKLTNVQISRNIYFRPSYFPLVSAFDYREGSCFDDWYIPTASFIFDITEKEISVSFIEADLSIDQYKDIVMKCVTESLTKIYHNHSKVYLHFSGGIDSMVILSFLMKMKLLDRTHLIYYHNLPEVFTQKNLTTSKKYQARQELFKFLKKQVADIVTDSVHISDIAHLANTVEYDRFTSYSTYNIMKKYSDNAHIGGHYGNQSLLHWQLFMDDVLLAGHDITGYHKLITPDSYAQEHVINQYSTREKLVPLKLKNILARSRMVLNTLTPRFYYPLLNETIAQALRRLKFDSVGFDYIVQAKLARDIMHYNVGDILDEFITSDGVEGDNLSTAVIPLDMLDANLFQIYDNVCHNPEGREWHLYEISRMQSTKTVPINTLVSFKMMQLLDSLIQGKSTLCTDKSVNIF